MGVINVLDKHVAELIAAGEVVERPASVIKELVENSIDAGSKHITVEIKRGGTTFMRVSDDGCGIARDDVKVAFLRHATSKVKVETDLESISTLGFRGEALASICAVSRLQLITKNINDEIGTSYIIEGGEEKSFEEAGCPNGTTFVIRDLFYNIPARAKFLKKDISEGNAVSNIIDKTALSHPEIAFTYIRDGKQVLKTYGDGKLMSAIYSVFGRDFANGLIPVDYQLDSIKITGYISKPVYSRPNRNMQNFFINGRYVKTRTAMAAIEEAFKGSIMVGKFPSCVLNIKLPYELIDVNVHPAKIEVRFINERPVFDAVYHAVKSSLMKFDDRKQAVFKTDSAFNDIKKFNPFENADVVLKHQNANKITEQKQNQENKLKAQNLRKNNEFNPFESVEFTEPEPKPQKTVNPQKSVNIDNLKVSDSQAPFDLYSKQAINNAKREQSYSKSADINIFVDESESNEVKNIDIPYNPPVITQEKQAESKVEVKDDNEIRLIKKDENVIRYIGEVFGTYIIAEKNKNEVVFIDKHAAHERMIYEQLKAEKAASFSQILLQPVTVTLGKAEYDAAINNLEMFKNCAFDVEDFGNSSVIVRSAPQYLDASEITDSIVEMSDYIAQGKNDIFTEKMDWFYHNVACRTAIKAGDRSTPEELIDIVKRLEDNPNIKYCPHGRPICFVMKKSELEKQFGRV
ncbi:MAG: DNA mismatch repair endonuclease MutL [Ruminococcus bromii]|nr:DNA mismatch repair endonuclease MutL [Ruminococcus bromii]MDY4085664.1 DNA mismatch repair endonuclease MutL [Ruminococcus bromii]MDY4710845.1 DNA mismatch repair endonuclease MutL [Ruminococcus bromii]